MTLSILEASKLNQYYGDSHTLWDISLEIRKGSCLCVLGRNGVGKTTLMESLMGLLPLQSGKIMFNGLELSSKSAEARARNGIGYVPQGRQIFPLLTVEENICTGLFARKARVSAIPSFIYDLFPVLKEMRSRRGGDLSGGQQQQLAFARALAIEPSLLLLDEPTEGIQPNIVQEIGDVILRLNKEHDIAVALVEQKLPFARRLAHDYLLLDRGRVVSNGPMDTLDQATITRYLTV